ncbi:MAG: TIM barrel protein [Dehalococcoidales bacterium]|jgi:deoxyribonuclease-4|nr:TIM barrel protein [Dehalococcoidales bacterium]MDX9986143.1 TIM barrel protein [Dehalococcoidales bacterium]
MNTFLFGTAGIPLSTPGSSTIDGIYHLKALGLDALEIEFVRQVYLTEKTALETAEAARDSVVKLSAHAPYYLNLNAAEPEKTAKSRALLFKAASIASLAGAYCLVFHPGYYLKNTSEDTFKEILTNLTKVTSQLEEAGSIINLAPETSGKPSQFGTLEEILQLCTSLGGVTPCIDFAHLHAYSGVVNTYEEFAGILDRVSAILGKEALGKLHLHVSGIHYGLKGELKHLPLDESDFNYPQLLQALIDANAGGVIICESPAMEADALVLKTKYHQLKAKR